MKKAEIFLKFKTTENNNMLNSSNNVSVINLPFVSGKTSENNVQIIPITTGNKITSTNLNITNLNKTFNPVSISIYEKNYSGFENTGFNLVNGIFPLSTTSGTTASMTYDPVKNVTLSLNNFMIQLVAQAPNFTALNNLYSSYKKVPPENTSFPINGNIVMGKIVILYKEDNDLY